MFGQASQTSNTFGGGFGSSGTGSGHQRTNTSLFTPASGTPSTGLFGSTSAPTSTASTTTLGGTGTFGGNAGFGSTTTGFGSNTTTNNTTTSTAGGPGLFGSTTSTAGTTNPTSSFSFGNTNTTGNTGFGSTSGFKLGTTNTTTTQPTLGFGTKPAFGGTTSLFGNQQQTQQQQQQQPDSLLSLHASFPDTNVPHFIVKPDKVTRTAIPPSLFNKDDQSTKAVQHEVMATATTKAYGEQRSVLPGFLTSATAPSSKPGQKRAFEGQPQAERRTLYKQSSNHSGVFGMGGDETFSDSKSRAAKEVDTPPMASLWDIGVNPGKYSSSLEAPKSTNKPDLWALAVMPPTQTGSGTGKTLSLGREANSLLINSNTSSSTAKGPTIVKVFGYPSEMQIAVIDHFSQCGKIEERYQSVGNWMTFRYASSEAAKEALENHGRIIAKDCMVGVVEAKSMTG